MTARRAAKVSHSPPAEEAAYDAAPRASAAAPVFDARHRQDLVQRAAEEGRLHGAPAGTVALRLGILVAVVVGCAVAWVALAGVAGRLLG